MDRSESKLDWGSLAPMFLFPALITALMLIVPFLANWSPPELIGLIGVLTAAALVITGLLFWRRVRLAQADAACKQAMLERGLSVDEIERLLRPAALLNDEPD